MTLNTLPDLNLTQTRIDDAVASKLKPRKQTLYLSRGYFAGVGLWEVSTTEGDESEAKVDVILPGITFGSEADLRDDLVSAVRGHAIKHLGEA